MHSQPSTAVYDQIGIGYTSRRRPDPRIFQRICEALASCVTVVNIGAGTGSYEPPSCTLAVEPSQRMIDQRSAQSAPCLCAFAERLPLEDRSFDGSLAVLTIHHWQDVSAGLKEMRRVSRQRVVLFTWDPEYPADFWLPRDYLPEILELDCPRFPTMRQLAQWLGPIEIQPVLIPADCADGFTGAYWKRPEAFLDPDVVRTNSVLAQLDPRVVAQGLARLGRDLESGAWTQRNAALTALEELDLGYRLIIADVSNPAHAFRP